MNQLTVINNELRYIHLKTHHDLTVWKKSIGFVTTVYKITEEYPKSEIYALTNQVRRAVVSVPSIIAEGAARTSKKNFHVFLPFR